LLPLYAIANTWKSDSPVQRLAAGTRLALHLRVAAPQKKEDAKGVGGQQTPSGSAQGGPELNKKEKKYEDADDNVGFR
jgi:hypothetical protein